MICQSFVADPLNNKSQLSNVSSPESWQTTNDSVTIQSESIDACRDGRHRNDRIKGEGGRKKEEREMKSENEMTLRRAVYR